MANQEQVPLCRVIAAAAHGAWVAFLVGILLVSVSFIQRTIFLAYCPQFAANLMGVATTEIARVWFHFMVLWKLVVLFFGLVAVMLSSWWRAL